MTMKLAEQWCGWAVDQHDIDYSRVPRILRPLVRAAFHLAVLVTVCYCILLLIWEMASDQVRRLAS